MEGDWGGDSALHAAASEGHARCCTLLLESAHTRPFLSLPQGAFANLPNKKGLTAAHLAGNCDVLFSLIRFDVDLGRSDNWGRSPLFTACALNKLDCAEYIIGCMVRLAVLRLSSCSDMRRCLLLLF